VTPPYRHHKVNVCRYITVGGWQAATVNVCCPTLLKTRHRILTLRFVVNWHCYDFGAFIKPRSTDEALVSDMTIVQLNGFTTSLQAVQRRNKSTKYSAWQMAGTMIIYSRTVCPVKLLPIVSVRYSTPLVAKPSCIKNGRL